MSRDFDDGAIAQFHRRLRCAVGAALAFAVLWLWVGPQLLTCLGNSETAGWSSLWFIPTTVAVFVTGGIVLLLPNRFTAFLFFLAMIPHVGVGFGLFPK